MILVDSSVWIDYFRGDSTPEADRLDALLGGNLLVTGDLVLAEVLQGFQRESEFNKVMQLLTSVSVVVLGGREAAIQAARNFRTLRALGVTGRKTIDTVIATRCIMDGHELLYSDRDFDPFVRHLGLQYAMDGNKYS